MLSPRSHLRFSDLRSAQNHRRAIRVGRMAVEAQTDVSTNSHVLTARAPYPPDTPATDTGLTQAEPIELVELTSKQDDSTAAPPVEEGPSHANTSEVDVRAQRRKVNIHFFTMCCSMFLLGWNDGTTGPLLPRIQEVYHVRVSRCTGTAGCLNEAIQRPTSRSCRFSSSSAVW